MKNEDEKQKELEQQEINNAWKALAELAYNQIVWGEGTINSESFIQLGKELFELKFKDDA